MALIIVFFYPIYHLTSKFLKQVADFGLSKEEIFDGRNSGLKGTYGYMDPAYISTNKLTTKSDIYSFGIILFELITAIHPHQNLLEYVNLVSHYLLLQRAPSSWIREIVFLQPKLDNFRDNLSSS